MNLIPRTGRVDLSVSGWRDDARALQGRRRGTRPLPPPPKYQFARQLPIGHVADYWSIPPRRDRGERSLGVPGSVRKPNEFWISGGAGTDPPAAGICRDRPSAPVTPR